MAFFSRKKEKKQEGENVHDFEKRVKEEVGRVLEMEL